MKTFKVLLKGEFQRLIRYKIIQVGFGVSVLWLLTMFLIGADDAREFVPLFIFMDASLMTVILIGAGLFYERQENTLKSMMTSPAGMKNIIFSKLISALYIALQSSLFLGIIAVLLFGATINFGLLIPFIIIIAMAHAMIGYTFSVLVKDFPALLAMTMVYMLVFAFPSIFYALDIIGGALETLLIISPSHASMLLIDFVFGSELSVGLIIGSLLYLVVLSFILGRFIVFPLYINKAIKE